MDVDVIITGIVGIITSIASAWCSYFFTRKKYNAEVNKDLIDNMQATLDFYMKLSDDNSKRLERILEINEELEKEVGILKEQVRQLTEELSEYRSRVSNPEIKPTKKKAEK